MATKYSNVENSAKKIQIILFVLLFFRNIYFFFAIPKLVSMKLEFLGRNYVNTFIQRILVIHFDLFGRFKCESIFKMKGFYFHDWNDCKDFHVIWINTFLIKWMAWTKWIWVLNSNKNPTNNDNFVEIIVETAHSLRLLCELFA